MISANELKSQNFETVENGYDKAQVDSAVMAATDTILAYQKENNELYHKLEVLASKIEEYRQEEDAIKTALVTAEKMADKIKRESKEAADSLISTSKQEADTTVAAAKAEAEKIVSEARSFSSDLINGKTAEANTIITNAQNKANEAINSSKIVAQDILDQAKEISTDLISKSKAEKEAYDILISAIKTDAKEYIENLKKLYTEQLDALNSANLESHTSTAQEADQSVADISEDVTTLVDEVEEFSQAIPEPVELPIIPQEEPVDEEPVVEELVEEVVEETAAPMADDDDFEIIEEAEEDIELPVIEEEEEDYDPMAAVAAFSQNEITPLDNDAPLIPEIDEEPAMEEKSLFDDGDQLPFENYFNVKREDVHNDKTQTISLVPPEDDEDDDESKFKGFFKKKK